MAGRKGRVVSVAAVLALGWCLALPSGAGAAPPIKVKAPEMKILGLPKISCAPTQLSYVIDGGNLANTCGGKTTMVGPGWRAYAWPAAVGASYHYVSASTSPPEDGTETMSFFPTITHPGYYEVWASYRGSENRTSAAPFFVYTDSNVTYKVVVDQREAGHGAFFSVKLGTFYFRKHARAQTPRTTGIIVCANEGARSSEAVDAIFVRYVRPLTPTGLSASDGTSTNAIDLAWNPVPSVKGYRVFRSLTSSTADAQLIANVSAPAVTYQDTPLGEGETYFYWVKTVGALGRLSGFSAPDEGSTGVTPPTP